MLNIWSGLKTQLWKGTTQGQFLPNLVQIGQVVSEKKSFEWKVQDDGWRTDNGQQTTYDGRQVMAKAHPGYNQVS